MGFVEQVQCHHDDGTLGHQRPSSTRALLFPVKLKKTEYGCQSKSHADHSKSVFVCPHTCPCRLSAGRVRAPQLRKVPDKHNRKRDDHITYACEKSSECDGPVRIGEHDQHHNYITQCSEPPLE